MRKCFLSSLVALTMLAITAQANAFCCGGGGRGILGVRGRVQDRQAARASNGYGNGYSAACANGECAIQANYKQAPPSAKQAPAIYYQGPHDPVP